MEQVVDGLTFLEHTGGIGNKGLLTPSVTDIKQKFSKIRQPFLFRAIFRFH